MKFHNLTRIVFGLTLSVMIAGCNDIEKTPAKSVTFNRPERWKFLEPGDKEYKDKQKTIEAIDAFWSQFQKDEPKLSALKNEDYGNFWTTWSKANLKKLDKNLNYEIGTEFDQRKKNYLIISCDNIVSLDPFVQTILERAPKLDDWNYYRYFSKYSHRQIENAIAQNTTKKLPSFSFQCRTMPANLVGIIITAPTFHGDNVLEDKNLAWEMLELALGEKDLYTWIGTVETRKGPSKLSTYSSSHRLQKQIAELKRLLINRLPDKPYFEIELDEKTLSNLRFSLTDRPFFSERFSKNGETFCALATKDKNPFDTEVKRDALKEDLKSLFLNAKLGCIIDASLETEKGFCIDLCVTDIDKTIAILRKYCNEHKMPPNTYLFFFDETLIYEWVGMYPNSDPYKFDSKAKSDSKKN